MKRIGLIGAGGHGKVAADTARAAGWEHVNFYDQAWPGLQTNGPWPVVGAHPSGMEDALFCSVGNNSIRARLFTDFGLEASPVLAHPSAILSPSVRPGAGTLIVAGSIVNADTLIGRGVILNTGCSVDHDCRIGDFAHISPGARLAGGVTVGDEAWIGIGAVVREGVTIGAQAMIAAGAVVIRDIPDGTRVGGVPAEPI